MPSHRVRSFVFTWNNPPEDHHSCLKRDEIEYCVYQMEEVSTKHLQGYIELKNQMAFNKVRKWFPWHIEQRKGSQQEAIDYCQKADSRIDGPWEWGTRKVMGSRTDIKTAYAMVSTGKRKRDVAEAMPMVDAKYHRALDRYRSLVERDESKLFRELSVTVLYGSPGSGKTRYVVDQYPDCYILNQPESQLWWDGYEGEDVLLIDDFYGWIKWGGLLKILDGYCLRLAIKGSHTYAKWSKIFITSNDHPSLWYPNKGFKGTALDRRVHKIINM